MVSNYNAKAQDNCVNTIKSGKSPNLVCQDMYKKIIEAK